MMTTEQTEVQTEVVPAASPEQAATPPEQTAAQPDEPKQVEEKTFTQAELDAILQTRLAKQERQALKRERELLESLRPQAQPKPEENTRPARDKFANDEEWVEAVTDWKLNQREQVTQKQRAEEAQRATASKTEGLYKAAEKLPGFNRDVFEELPLTPVIAHAITDSEIAPQLMAHMAANPDVVDRIAKLSPARQAAEIGRLEEKLSAVKPVNVAPPPIARAKGDGPVHNGDLSKLPMAEYIAARAKMGARWAR